MPCPGDHPPWTHGAPDPGPTAGPLSRPLNQDHERVERLNHYGPAAVSDRTQLDRAAASGAAVRSGYNPDRGVTRRLWRITWPWRITPTAAAMGSAAPVSKVMMMPEWAIRSPAAA